MHALAPVFVLGSGPGVGKTLIAAGLLRALGARGAPAVGIKPVETGCSHDEAHDLVGRDGEALRAAAPTPLPPLVASPYRFAPTVSPALAASQAGLELALTDLEQAVSLARTHGLAVVEGPGGPLCPIAADGFTADLAAALKARTLIVARDCLGADAEVLLALEACAKRGVDVRGVILSRRDADATDWSNAKSIRAHAEVRLFESLPTLGEDRIEGCCAHLEEAGVVDALTK